MEINLENAFSFIFRVTYGILIPYMDNVFNNTAEICHNIVKWLLKRPLLSTVVSATVFVTITGVITFSMMVIFGVVCIVSSIILFEGLFFVAAFMVVLSITIILMALAISFNIVQTSFSRNHSGEENEE